MKKILCIAIVSILVISSVGCSSETSKQKTEEELKAEVRAELEAEEEAKAIQNNAESMNLHDEDLLLDFIYENYDISLEKELLKDSMTVVYGDYNNDGEDDAAYFSPNTDGFSKVAFITAKGEKLSLIPSDIDLGPIYTQDISFDGTFIHYKANGGGSGINNTVEFLCLLLSSQDSSTSYFNLYGSSETKTIQQETLHLDVNDKIEETSTGAGPILLACDSSGKNYDLYAEMYSFQCSTNMKINESYEEYGNAGVVLGVNNPGNGNNQFRGYYIGITPKRSEVIVGTCNNNWNQLLSASLPSGVDPYDCELKVNIKTEYQFGSSMYTLSVAVDGNYVIQDEYLGATSGSHTSPQATYISTFTGKFGMRTYMADVEYSDFKIEKK